MNKEHIHSLLISLWSIQNSILQSARGIFITVESILISFAALIPIKEHNWGFVLILSALGIPLIAIWRLIVQDRGYNDSYLRLQIIKLENPENGKLLPEKALTDFRAWQEKRITQKRSELSSDDRGRQLLSSCTRKILDCILPMIFLVLWGILLVYWFYWFFVTYF